MYYKGIEPMSVRLVADYNTNALYVQVVITREIDIL